MRLRQVALLAAGIISAIASQGAAQGPNVEILAEYPRGNFLENLDVLSDGRVVFTSYFARTIEILDTRGKASTLAHVSAHPVSILALDSGFLVAAHGQPFTSGPAFVETQQFLLLDEAGRELAMFKAPEARFLNGMVRHSGASVLVADSIAGKIWQVDAKARSVTAWLADAGLAPDPSVKEFRPGANGIKRQGDRILVSNSSRGTLATVAVDSGGGPAGPLMELAKVGRIDDFVIGPGGEIIFATHGATVQRRAADGTVTTILPSGGDGCTAVALVKRPDGADALLVLTTGGFSEGRKEPARVLRIDYTPPK
jgi:hypothetical protein